MDVVISLSFKVSISSVFIVFESESISKISEFFSNSSNVTLFSNEIIFFINSLANITLLSTFDSIK